MSFKAFVSIGALAVLPSAFGMIPVAGQASGGGLEEIRKLDRAVSAAERIRLRLYSGHTVVVQRPVLTDIGIEGIDEASGYSLVFSLGDVHQVWRRGSAAVTGAAIGAGIGALAGAAAGVAAAHFCMWGNCPPPTSGETIGAAALGALGGGLVFGGVGALLGAAFRRWKSAYKADQRTVRPLVVQNGVGVTIRF